MASKAKDIRQKIAKRSEVNKNTVSGGFTAGKLCQYVEAIRMSQDSIGHVVEMGSFTDSDNAKIEAGETAIAQMKQKATRDLMGLQKPLVPTADEIDTLDDFFEALIIETDNKEGNLALVEAMVKTLKLDFPSLVEDRGLLAVAACDGSLGYMKALLSYPHIRCDTVEVVSSCMFNQQYRIPATALVFEFREQLNLADASEDLIDAWREFFADIGSKKRAIAREDRAGRLELMEAMAKYEAIPIDFEEEGPDAQTVFSRAAHEGDAELVQMLLKTKRVDVNRVQSDTTTALIQAVFSARLECVKLLMDAGAATEHKGENGTALDMALSLGREPAIIAALKSQGAEPSMERSTLTKAPTFAPVGLKSALAARKEAEKEQEDDTEGYFPSPTPPKAEKPTAEKASPHAKQKQSPAPAPTTTSGSKATDPKAKSTAKKETTKTTASSKDSKVKADKKKETAPPSAPGVKNAGKEPPAASGSSGRKKSVTIAHGGKEPPLSTNNQQLELARRLFNDWIDLTHSKRRVRRRSMMRKVIQVKGSSSTIQRMYFRDWVNWLFQRRMENRMNTIRDKIAKRNKERKEAPTKKAEDAYTCAKLATAVDVIKMTLVSIQSMQGMGSFSDEDCAKVETAEKTVADIKLKATAELKKVNIVMNPTAEQMESLSEFLETIIIEGDAKVGNLGLVEQILKKVRLDFGTLCEDHGLVAVAACDGSLGYMKALLQHRDVRCDTVEVVSSCMFNQQCRIPATALAFKYRKELNLADASEDLIDAWREFFADIGSKKRAIAREDRAGRLELMEAMAKYEAIPIDFEEEGPDAQTVFSRAAHEGDAELVQMLLKTKRVDVNRVQSDTTTALIQAVFSGNVECVKAIMSDPSIDVKHKSDDGTALDIATALKRDPAIVKSLKEHGALNTSGGSKLTRAPTFAVPKGRKNSAAEEDDTDGYFTPRPPSTETKPAGKKQPATARAPPPSKPVTKKTSAKTNSTPTTATAPALPSIKPAPASRESKPMPGQNKVLLDANQRQDLLKKAPGVNLKMKVPMKKK